MSRPWSVLPALLLLLLLAVRPAPLRAQVVETPVAFDSAGRVLAISPVQAARARLGPPAWRVTGDFTEARLYALGGDAYVLVVARPSGAVERYPITGADVAELRARISTLPPDLTSGVRRNLRNRFILNQTLLGLGVYAPSFALTVTNDDAGRTASWLLVSGLSYFGASTLARDLHITEPMNRLATHAALRGGLAGLGVGEAADFSADGRAAAVFFGSVGGTATGLALGQNLTIGQVAAASFGADAAALMALGLTRGLGSEDSRTIAGTMVGAGLLGYPLGWVYERSVPHTVTSGDVRALAVAGAVGALAASPFLVGQDDPSDEAVALGLTAGFAAGLVAGDRLLVARYDHNNAEGALLALGTVAGGLMGAGVATLADRDDNEVLVASLGTVGAVLGLVASEAYLMPRADARRLASNVEVNPLGLALAAGGVQGRHALVRVTF